VNCAQFSDVGFMAEEMNAWIDITSPKGKRFVSLALDISALVLRDIYSVQVKKADCHRRRNLRDPVLTKLFMRGFSLYQSTMILARRGLASDAANMCRGLLDLAFKFFAIQRHAESLLVYIAEDQHFQLMLAKNVAKFPELYAGTSTTKGDLERLILELKERIKESGHETPLRISEWADRAQMESTYRVVYSLLSSHTHSGVRSLEQLVVIDEDDDMEALKFEGEVSELVLSVAADHMIILCEGFAEEFGLDWKAPLAGFRERLRAVTTEP
jgi:hypothetical protein